MALKEIKLKDLLTMREPAKLLRSLAIPFPPVELGSPTLVDQMVLLALEELIGPETILEIGTYRGFTTRLFLLNSSASRIYSVDLPPSPIQLSSEIDKDMILTDPSENDKYLIEQMSRYRESYLTDLTNKDLSRLTLIKADSTAVNYQELIGSVQYVFVDGGHSHEIVKSDTENSLNLVKHGVIVWHDFNSLIHSDVSAYLRDLSSSIDIYHIKGSLCAFSLVGTKLSFHS